MINTDTYYHINRIAEERKIAQKVLENRKAVVVYFELSGSYMAIEKQTSGKEYTFSGLYHRSTRADFAEELRAMMQDAPDERTRQDIQRIVAKVEQM